MFVTCFHRTQSKTEAESLERILLTFVAPETRDVIRIPNENRARKTSEVFKTSEVLADATSQLFLEMRISGGKRLLRITEVRLIIRQTKSVRGQIDQFLCEYQQAKPIGQSRSRPWLCLNFN